MSADPDKSHNELGESSLVVRIPTATKSEWVRAAHPRKLNAWVIDVLNAAAAKAREDAA
jgi:hypothetical protein